MTHYRLPSNVYFCISEGAAVFLDLKADRYAGIGVEETRSFIRIANSDAPLSEEDVKLAEALTGQGLLCRTSNPSESPMVPTPCRHAEELLVVTAPDGASITVTFGAFLRFVRAFAAAVISFRMGSLGRTISRFRKRKSSHRLRKSALNANDIRLLVQQFRRLRPLFYTARDQCLFDSIVLVEFLALYHVRTDLVVGVKMIPFQAHAWVQWGKYSVNEFPNFLRGFTPIFAG